jgi:N-acetylglutamate synthase-like GNAT family acetyltransferase
MCVIRPATASDVDALSTLALRSKAHWGYDEEFLSACREELTLHEDDLATRPTFVLEQAGRAIGFYTLERVTESQVELWFLFVEPDAIGQGHGRRLLEHAKAEAIARGFSTMVIQADPNATEFYQHLGGRLVGSQPSGSIPGRMLPLLEIQLD